MLLLSSAAVDVRSALAGLDDGNRASLTGTLTASTSTGRRGVYYLPRNPEGRALPVLVMLHGTGGTGSGVLARLRPVAETEKFIAVAPDSVSVAGVWLVEPGARGATEDHRHVVSCLREVRALPGVRIDGSQVLIAGFSVGGGAASYIASHEDPFTAFAVLHGHVVLDGLGPHRARGWLSTGDRDSRRTAEAMKRLADQLTHREGFGEVEMRVFPGGHELGEDELAAMVAWWLRRPVRGGR